MSNALEDRLTRMAALVPEPPANATARAREAALDSLPVAAGAARGRRSLRLLTAAAGFAGIGVILALLIISTPSDGPSAGAASLRPDPASLGDLLACAEPPPLLSIPCIEGTEAARRATPALADAPWLYRRPDGARPRLADTAPRPSLEFPPGTTYGQALDALLVSVTLTGRLPEGAGLAAPLPEGVVLLQPPDPAQGIAIDLRAPFGYRPPDGSILSSTLASSPGEALAGGAGGVWPAGTHVAVPALPQCMVVADRTSTPLRCGRGDTPALTGSDPSVAPLPAVPLAPPVASQRPPAPDLRLPELAGGGTLALDDLRGQVVVLSLWASWCEPCADQAPVLEAVAERYRSNPDVAVVGVSVQDLREEALGFVARNGLTFTMLRDPADEARRALDVPALPETFLIDRRGRIAQRIAGSVVTPTMLTAAVDRLNAEGP